jgi:hypothetical protein
MHFQAVTLPSGVSVTKTRRTLHDHVTIVKDRTARKRWGAERAARRGMRF